MAKIIPEYVQALHARHIAGETIDQLAINTASSRNRFYQLFHWYGLPITPDLKGKGRGRAGIIEPHIPRATIHPTITDLSWAAGFMEGEGWFGHGRGTERCSAVQNNPEPILKLQRMFGGPVKTRQVKGNKLSQNPITEWRINGVLARGVMMTLYSFLSEVRRAQIREALRITRQEAIARGPRKPYEVVVT